MDSISLAIYKHMYFTFLESTTTSDQLLITTSVDVLCSQNMLIYNEAVDICLADIQTKMKLLEDKLATMSLSV